MKSNLPEMCEEEIKPKLWIEELRNKTKRADKFPFAKSYDFIRNQIEECAEFGSSFTFFDYDYLDDETREKLRNEGLAVEDIMEIGKTRVCWE